METKLNTVETEAKKVTTSMFDSSKNELLQVRAYWIASQEELDRAAVWIKEIKVNLKDVKAQHKHLKEPSLESGRRIDAMFKPLIATLDESARVLKSSADTYIAEQDRIRREKEQAEFAAAEKERVRKQKLADNAEKKGNAEKADEHRQAAAASVAPVVEKTVHVPTGMSFRTIWNAEVISLEDLVIAVADQIKAKRNGDGNISIPIDVLEANMTRLNSLAVAMHDKLDIPGVKAVSRRV